MHDADEIERLLQRYRPAGPPPDLRERCLQVRLPVRRAWPWAAAAALLLAASLGFHAASSALRAGYGFVPADAAAHERAALAEALGDDPDAEQIVDLVVSREQMLRAGETPAVQAMEPR